MKTKYSVLLLILLMAAASVIIINQTNKTSTTDFKYSSNTKEIPYNLNKPTKKIKLTHELQEISALSYHKNKQLACLHDERADIFMISYPNKEIQKKLKIAGNGDYEGIEIIGNTAYMLKSNGVLLKIANFTTDTMTVTKLETGLSQSNDCEGLGYDPQTKHLLIACKNKPWISGSTKKMKNKRAVYEYDIINEKLNKIPRFLISLKEIEKKTGKKKFMPSGIAIHPISHNAYIIASVGKLMIVLNKDRQIISFKHLDPEIFRQAEGICFTPDGKKLFISNEGRNKKGNILVFEIGN